MNLSNRGLRSEPARALPAEIPLMAANGNMNDRSVPRHVPEEEECIDTTGMPGLEDDGEDKAGEDDSDPPGSGSDLALVIDETADSQVHDEDANGHGTMSNCELNRTVQGVCVARRTQEALTQSL